MRRVSRKAVTDTSLNDQDPQSLAWMYALLLDYGALNNFLHGHDGFTDDNIARALGVYHLAETDEDNEFSQTLSGNALRQAVKHELRQQRRKLVCTAPLSCLPDQLAHNLTNLAALLNLDSVDQQLLIFCTLLKTNPLLEDCAEQIGQISFGRFLSIVSDLLKVPEQAVRHALSSSGRLVQTGLLSSSMTFSRRNSLPDYINITHDDVLALLRYSQSGAASIFQSAFRLAPKPTLSLDDFAYLQMLKPAHDYLQSVMQSAKTGVNILLYGPPGTGKSAFTRMLAHELGAELYEIACTDESGDPINRHRRLCALRSAMSVLNPEQTLVVLDEIEDLFEGNRLFGLPMPQDRNKGWVNRTLEENPIPCFWLTNNIDALDNAYIRRFDLVIQLDNPPQAQRERIARQAGGADLSQSLVKKLASHEHLVPAVITRALEVATQISADKHADEGQVTLLIDATLKAQGFSRLGQNSAQALPDFYSPQYCNADVDLLQLIEGLRHNPQARLCLYGPPGTGKTAFACWLTQQLQKPLMSKRASDLISPYIGQTEVNFARAFSQARNDNAVLLLDEADSFLQDRRNAVRSWEVTAVNEMLTQMESYPGLFIASTNLIENLDEASLRRFDLKINFGYLSSEQATQLLRQHLRQLKLKKPDSLKLGRFVRSSKLTPGDFAMLARRSRFKPFIDGNEFVDALLAESALKPNSQQRPIGFVH